MVMVVVMVFGVDCGGAGVVRYCGGVVGGGLVMLR